MNMNLKSQVRRHVRPTTVSFRLSYVKINKLNITHHALNVIKNLLANILSRDSSAAVKSRLLCIEGGRLIVLKSYRALRLVHGT